MNIFGLDFLLIGIVFLLSFAFKDVYDKYDIPWYLVPLIVGLVGSLYINTADRGLLFIIQLATVFVSFRIGYYIDLEKFIKYSYNSFLFYMISLVISIVLSILLVRDVKLAIILAAMLVMSSETIIYKLKLNKDIKSRLLEISLINSILGTIIVYSIISLKKSNILEIVSHFSRNIVYILLILGIAYFIGNFLLTYNKEFLQKLREEGGILLIISILFIMAALSYIFEIGLVYGAFLTGIILRSFIFKTEQIRKELDHLIEYFFAPILFFAIGYSSNLYAIHLDLYFKLMIINVLALLLTSYIVFKKLLYGLIFLFKTGLDLILAKNLLYLNIFDNTLYTTYILASLTSTILVVTIMHMLKDKLNRPIDYPNG